MIRRKPVRITVELDSDVAARLNTLVTMTGRTKKDIVARALLGYPVLSPTQEQKLAAICEDHGKDHGEVIAEAIAAMLDT